MSNRIKTKLKQLLNEAPYDFGLDRKDLVDDTGLPNPDEEELSGRSQASVGSGLVGKRPPTQGNIRTPEHRPVDPAVVSHAMKQKGEAISSDVKSGKYDLGLELFHLTPEEQLQKLKKYIESSEFTSALKQTAEKSDGNVSKFFGQIINDMKRDIVEKISDIVQQLNVYNDTIGGSLLQQQFSGGWDSVSKKYIQLPLPHSQNPEDALKEIIASILSAARSPQHMINILLNTDVPTAYNSEELYDIIEKKLENVKAKVSQLPPRIARDINRRIKTAEKTLETTTNVSIAKAGKGKQPLLDFVNDIEKSVTSATLNEAVAPRNIEAVKQRIQSYYNRYSNPKHAYHGEFKKGYDAIQQVFANLMAIERNNVIIRGINNKLQKLENLKGKTIKFPEPENVDRIAAITQEMIIDPDSFDPETDFVVVDDLADANTIIHESKTPEYKRQRKITRKTALQEAWKKYQTDITKKQLQKDKPQSPNIHLGGLS